MSLPRNEPAWCVKGSHDDSEVGLHYSRQLHVGSRFERGELTACLRRGGDAGETRLLVIAAHGSSITADLSLEQARRHRDHVDALIRQAETETRR